MTNPAERTHNAAAEVTSGYDEAFINFTNHFGRDTAASLMHEFVEAMEELIPDLELKMAQHDIKLVKPLTHRLIGLCPVYKAGRLADLGHLMEQEMKRGDWQAAEVHNQQVKAAFLEYMGRSD